jgi:hypothetical protein
LPIARQHIKRKEVIVVHAFEVSETFGELSKWFYLCLLLGASWCMQLSFSEMISRFDGTWNEG